MASRAAMFWVLSALTLCSKFAGGTALEARLGWDGLEFLSTTPESTAHTNNMADQIPAFDESLIEWETLSSKNGKSFRVGREKTDCVKGDAIKKAPGQNSFRIDVNWPVGGGWIDTSDAVAEKTGISKVRIHQIGASRYLLVFVNTRTYDYIFVDESGRPLLVKAYYTGTHEFQYYSDKPTIKEVEVY